MRMIHGLFGHGDSGNFTGPSSLSTPTSTPDRQDSHVRHNRPNFSVSVRTSRSDETSVHVRGPSGLPASASSASSTSVGRSSVGQAARATIRTDNDKDKKIGKDGGMDKGKGKGKERGKEKGKWNNEKGCVNVDSSYSRYSILTRSVLAEY